jgi:hypothetical protein
VIGSSSDETQQLAGAGKMRRQVSASAGVERRPDEVVKFNGKLCDWHASEVGQRGSERLGLSVRHKPCELPGCIAGALTCPGFERIQTDTRFGVIEIQRIACTSTAARRSSALASRFKPRAKRSTWVCLPQSAPVTGRRPQGYTPSACCQGA